MNSLFGEMEYNKPFLVTYLNTATFSFYLIPLLFKKWRHNTRHSSHQDVLPASPTDENTKLLDNSINNNNNVCVHLPVLPLFLH
ncbi:hypothetical protein FB192DRAFT_1117470 [Mucor lusitanicus]|uniref:Uncharacterized protein n=1 Tax=Mucor circinelloides f. lusitanicus TaxID=29924 RepID=A0A8H4BED1_MUCCL|nr:hypothetical protein FB192DRAFT_1117470 [Mucor lusitanicus]